MSIESELLALKRPDGRIMPDDVERWAAKNPNSELHRRLEWDDKHAAKQWRHFQIRQLIAIYVVRDDGTRNTISLRIDRKDGGGYRGVEQVLSNRDMRDAALREFLADMERYEERYSWLEELAPIFAETGRVRRRVAQRSTPKPATTDRPAA